MRLVRFVVVLLFISQTYQHHMFADVFNVSANVLANTLLIQTEHKQGAETVRQTGTAFTIDVDGRQYLITAKHMVAGMSSEGVVGVAEFDDHHKIYYRPFTMKIFPCRGPADIAVLIPLSQLTVGDTMETAPNFTFGQNAYFVGFPFGMYSTAKSDPRQRPVGMVKGNLISGVQYESDGTPEGTNDADLILLDGYNVFGFSGSPIVYLDTHSTPIRSYVIGVISGFQPDYGSVLVPKKIRREDIKPEDRGSGRLVEGEIIDGRLVGSSGHFVRFEPKRVNNKPTNEMVMLNTGIVRAYGIQAAINVIKLHPIGPLVSKRQ